MSGNDPRAEILANPKLFIEASEEIKNDKDFVREVLIKDPQMYQYAGGSVVNDPELSMMVFKQDPTLFQYANPYTIRENKDIATDVVKADPSMYEFAGVLQDDKTFSTELFTHHPTLFQHAAYRVRSSPDIARDVIAIAPEMYQFGSGYVKDDEDIARNAIAQRPEMYQYAPEEIKEDEDIARDAIARMPEMYKYAPEVIQEMRDIKLDYALYALKKMLERYKGLPTDWIISNLYRYLPRGVLDDPLFLSRARDVDGIPQQLDAFFVTKPFNDRRREFVENRLDVEITPPSLAQLAATAEARADLEEMDSNPTLQSHLSHYFDRGDSGGGAASAFVDLAC